FSENHNLQIIDLPGTYGLQTTSPDEEVTRNVLLGRLDYQSRPDVILAVADATNLRMSLRMLLELKQLALPMLVSLNLSDVARRRGLKIDIPKL
ncbi:FeoB small GTPase domain-containing protein, partial [Chryseobacterium gambrini]